MEKKELARAQIQNDAFALILVLFLVAGTLYFDPFLTARETELKVRLICLMPIGLYVGIGVFFSRRILESRQIHRSA